MTDALIATIETAWEDRANIGLSTHGRSRDAVDEALRHAGCGARPASPNRRRWLAGQPVAQEGGVAFLPPERQCADRRRSRRRVTGWTRCPANSPAGTRRGFREAGFRAVPGALRAPGHFIAKNVVLMPSFVNIGAYVDEGTMVDTWVTVGAARRSARMSIFRAASALAACWSRCRRTRNHRGRLLHRRALGSCRRRAHRQGRGALDGRVHRPVDQDH